MLYLIVFIVPNDIGLHKFKFFLIFTQIQFLKIKGIWNDVSSVHNDKKMEFQKEFKGTYNDENVSSQIKIVWYLWSRGLLKKWHKLFSSVRVFKEIDKIPKIG